LIKDGYHIPTRLPLTKSEEKALTLVRRKIRNKKSAKTSRERKKTYIEGLEKRVDACTKENKFLHDQIKLLKAQNRYLRFFQVEHLLTHYFNYLFKRFVC
jgi:cyclic AMP-responsive element-binding protein 3